MGSAVLDFSIIIPTYNRPVQLGQCLTALTHLDYARDRFEAIVVDDGSKVPVAHVAESFRRQIDLTILSVPNGGPAAARNHGAARARGLYLAFTDDDCVPDHRWLDALHTRASANAGAMLGGRTLNALPENLCSALSQLVIETAYACYNVDPDHGRFFASNNLAVPAAPFRELGGFDPAFRTAEDRDLCARWLRRGGRLLYTPEAVVHHAHRLTLAGLWRQHFAYGRGAYRFHGKHGRWWRIGVDRGFYRDLVLRPYSTEPIARAATMTLLLVLQQTANAAGFLAEMLAHVA